MVGSRLDLANWLVDTENCTEIFLGSIVIQDVALAQGLIYAYVFMAVNEHLRKSSSLCDDGACHLKNQAGAYMYGHFQLISGSYLSRMRKALRSSFEGIRTNGAVIGYAGVFRSC